jgi:hypothetical protein
VFVGVDDPNRTHLGIATMLKAISHGQDATARAILCLEDGDIVTTVHQVIATQSPARPAPSTTIRSPTPLPESLTWIATDGECPASVAAPVTPKARKIVRRSVLVSIVRSHFRSKSQQDKGSVSRTLCSLALFVLWNLVLESFGGRVTVS